MAKRQSSLVHPERQPEVFIALYRGINVGGKNSVKMPILRSIHEQMGHLRVRSYVQSGNIVFESAADANEIAQKLVNKFSVALEFTVKVIVVSARRWQTVIQNNPYAAAAANLPQTVHVGICGGKPDAESLQKLLIKVGRNEEYMILDDLIYLHFPDGLGTSKFAAGMEKAIGTTMTARNWRTVAALQAMASET